MTIRRLALLVSAFTACLTAAAAESVSWQPWSDAAFAQARAERKYVILDLEAVWCHWCHVMDATTYRDPAVAALIGRNYVAVRVDQDSRPDLANRYEDYGWPATVIYAPDGTEIVKRQGYIDPRRMANLLRAVLADPSPVNDGDNPPEAPAAGPTVLDAGRRAALGRQWLDGYDAKEGGWGFVHKYLDWDTVELAMREGAGGDAVAAARARETLGLERRLLDPVFGGVYQYSAGGNWAEPHFEKIMQMQAENLRIYSMAWGQFGDPADRDSARLIHGYLRNFLTSPEGAFYTSQDADLASGEPGSSYYALDAAGRRLKGTPRIDTHVYARENGWAMEALASFAAATGDDAARREAETAARWILAHRALPGGGFRHDESDPAGPYLADTLAMGRAFLALHQVTADSAWLRLATGAADFINAHFGRGAAPGFATADTTRPSFPAPRPEFDENVSLARFARALLEATGREEYRAMAATALRWLLAPGMSEGRGFAVAGLLLAEEEARTDPLHVAIIGARNDPAARALFETALRAPTGHKLIEWWDPRTEPAPRGEDIYPRFPRAAAFACSNGTCSAPIFTPKALAALLHRAAPFQKPES